MLESTGSDHGVHAGPRKSHHRYWVESIPHLSAMMHLLGEDEPTSIEIALSDQRMSTNYSETAHVAAAPSVMLSTDF